MRYLLIPIFTCVFSVLIYSNAVASNQNFDFRSSRWEMSKEEVMKSEPNVNWAEYKKSLGFITKICNEKVEVNYFFENGSLSHCSYDFDKIEKNNPQKLCDDILSHFKQKYKLVYTKTDNYGSSYKLKNNRTDIHIILCQKSLMIIFWNSTYIKKEKEERYKEDIQNM